MGHVDHGKTSLLDAIRHTHVTAGEAGGITQHIGAYKVEMSGREITFLDTPGHAAFTSMRARGANVTDIAILVVAADDGIMPQTVEAINHAKAAGVSIIVAINKMDKPDANPDRVKQELTEHGLVPEEWGGDVICVPVSAITHEGIDTLLENGAAGGRHAVSSRPTPTAGPGAPSSRPSSTRAAAPWRRFWCRTEPCMTGDVIIAGTSVGRVRVMTDDKGRKLKDAGPSTPVEIIGLAEVPQAGDDLLRRRGREAGQGAGGAAHGRRQRRSRSARLPEGVRWMTSSTRSSRATIKELNHHCQGRRSGLGRGGASSRWRS